MKTLREVCNQLHITRRVIQGYQSKNLIKPDGTNKFGHLLFEQSTIDRIGFIRYLQMMDMTIDEIAEVIDYPTEDLIEVIKDHCHKLKLQKNLLEQLIDKTESIIESLDYCKDVTSDLLMETVRKELL